MINADNKSLTNTKWYSLEKAAEILNLKEKTLKEKCRNNEFSYRVVKDGNKINYYLFIDIESQETASKNKKYSEAPEWSKLQAEKYVSILNACEGLKGKQLQEFLLQWNSDNSNYKTSYPCVIKMRKRYKEQGISGLLAKYGHSNNGKIKEEYFDYFKNLYLKEGAPSLYSCWELTLGYAIRSYGEQKIYFPSHMSFKRKIEKEIPKQSIYLARYGESAWNRKYGSYIERDYSNIICGKVWVSDHAQIDVACLTEEGDVVFPWVTAWRDFKSGKWLGWILQYSHPNSDHIFQSFYYAAEEYGLPTDVIIDNGKDYRSKDFAGGRKNIKVESDKAKTNSMLSELNIKVNFALPYNAQTKPIERDFLKIKELLSKHCVGYRGGNVVERPEKLAVEIKRGKILPFHQFKAVFDDFIINVLNKRPSQGKNLQGLSPDALFNQEFKEKITTSKDALKLFCMRTSRIFTVGRNGIKDNQLGITYWSDWMINNTGLKVYLRRDPQNYKEAWAFKSENNEFVGKVIVVKSVAALYADEITKEEFKTAMANKKRNLKIAREYIKQNKEISLEEQCLNYKSAYASLEKKSKPKVSRIANTNMDKAIRKNKENEVFGKQDLSIFLDETTNSEEKIYLFETDILLDEEVKGVANGY